MITKFSLADMLFHHSVFFKGVSCSAKNILYNTIYGDASPSRSVFYLDGYQGLTTRCMRSRGFSDVDLFTANIFENTAKELKVTILILI